MMSRGGIKTVFVKIIEVDLGLRETHTWVGFALPTGAVFDLGAAALAVFMIPDFSHTMPMDLPDVVAPLPKILSSSYREFFRKGG